MKSASFVLPIVGLALALPALAEDPAKVGVINLQSAIVGTKDGQKAASDIQARFNPKKADLDKRQGDIAQLQDQLNRGRTTLSEDARQKLVRDIDQKTKLLNRDTEDAPSLGAGEVPAPSTVTPGSVSFSGRTTW